MCRSNALPHLCCFLSLSGTRCGRLRPWAASVVLATKCSQVKALHKASAHREWAPLQRLFHLFASDPLRVSLRLSVERQTPCLCSFLVLSPTITDFLVVPIHVILFGEHAVHCALSCILLHGTGCVPWHSTAPSLDEHPVLDGAVVIGRQRTLLSED